MSKDVASFYEQENWKPDCITYSYAQLWHSNKNAFRRRYYHNEPQPIIPAYEFGSYVSNLIKDEPNHPSLANLPISRYTAIDEEYRTRLGDVEFVFHPDLFEPSTFNFGEVKTGLRTSSGKPPWTPQKVSKHMQLDAYSLGIETLFGQVDEKCVLYWLVKDREQIEIIDGIMTDGPIYLTDEVISFDRVITPMERYSAKEWLLQAYAEILLDWNSYQKNL